MVVRYKRSNRDVYPLHTGEKMSVRYFEVADYNCKVTFYAGDKLKEKPE